MAEQVIDLLETTRFPGIKSQVEVADVPTMMTGERYMGGSHGFMAGPAKKFNPMVIALREGLRDPAGARKLLPGRHVGNGNRRAFQQRPLGPEDHRPPVRDGREELPLFLMQQKRGVL